MNLLSLGFDYIMLWKRSSFDCYLCLTELDYYCVGVEVVSYCNEIIEQYFENLNSSWNLDLYCFSFCFWISIFKNQYHLKFLSYDFHLFCWKLLKNCWIFYYPFLQSRFSWLITAS